MVVVVMEYSEDATVELTEAANDFLNIAVRPDEFFQADNIRRFIERGANPNIILAGQHKLSLIQEICANKQLSHDIGLQTFGYLLSLRDIDTDYMDAQGYRLIHHTAIAPHEEFLLMFFRLKRDAASRYINWYCRQENEDKIPYILVLETPLFLEISNYTSINSIKPLLEHGANPNQKCMSDKTPFHSLCMKLINRIPEAEDEQIFHLFLDYGADIYARDNVGQTPLSLVAGMNISEKLFALLLQRRGADIISVLDVANISPNNRRWLAYNRCDAFNSVLHPRVGINSAFHDMPPEIIDHIRQLALRK